MQCFKAIFHYKCTGKWLLENVSAHQRTRNKQHKFHICQNFIIQSDTNFASIVSNIYVDCSICVNDVDNIPAQINHLDL